MKSVLIVADVKFWAQWRCATGVQKYRPDYQYAVEITDLSGYKNYTPDRLAQFDVVHVLYLGSATRRQGIRRLTGMLASHAWMYPELKKNDWRTRGVTQGRCRAVAEQMLPGLDAVVARNGELERFGCKHNPKTRYIPVGVDLEVFKPAERERSGKLRVGWCGQIGGKTSFKGHAEILVPLMKRLGDACDWQVNTRDAASARSIVDMAAWYQSLDVFLCTASAEGTPNPPVEAAACGVPVISTNVGTIRHWAVLQELGLRVRDYGNQDDADRVVGDMALCLDWLRHNGRYRRECGVVLREWIEREHDYRIVAPKLLEFICNA
jgi:glycosyltransferase involved in cell wall biosynthesis